MNNSFVEYINKSDGVRNEWVTSHGDLIVYLIFLLLGLLVWLVISRSSKFKGDKKCYQKVKNKK